MRQGCEFQMPCLCVIASTLVKMQELQAVEKIQANNVLLTWIRTCELCADASLMRDENS
jgi:hypothetical protein